MRTDMRIFGMSIRVDDDNLFPIRPTPREEATRIVRNGLADILRWLGEPVGPAVDAETHGVVFVDRLGRPDDLLVSHELYEELVVSVRPGLGMPSPPPKVVESIWRASVDCQRSLKEAEVTVSVTEEEQREQRLAWAREQLETRIALRRAHDYYSRSYPSPVDATIRITYTKEPT